MNQAYPRRQVRPRPAPPTLAQVEESYILKVIAETRNLTEAALVLDINKATLYRRRRQEFTNRTNIVPLVAPEPICGTEEQHWWALAKEQRDRLDAENKWLRELAGWLTPRS